MSRPTLASTMKWRFVMHQTSRPVTDPKGPPSTRNVQRFLAMESAAVTQLARVLETHRLTTGCPVETEAFRPMYDALRRDTERYGAIELDGRVALFTHALVQYLATLEPYAVAAWWFVLVFTHAAGSWGAVDGVEYVGQWLRDADLRAIEDLFTGQVRYWTRDNAKTCLDELDYAIRYRSAMLAVLLDDRDANSTADQKPNVPPNARSS